MQATELVILIDTIHLPEHLYSPRRMSAWLIVTPHIPEF
jgi:hypothetical protein